MKANSMEVVFEGGPHNGYRGILKSLTPPPWICVNWSPDRYVLQGVEGVEAKYKFVEHKRKQN